MLTEPSWQVEKAGSTISQTLAGLILDLKSKKKPSTGATALLAPDALHAIQYLLNVYFAVNIVQLAGTVLLWKESEHIERYSRHSRHVSSSSYQPVASDDVEQHPSASTSHPRRFTIPSESAVVSSSDDEGNFVVGPTPRTSDGARMAGHLRNDGSWAYRHKPLLLNPNVSFTNYTASLASSPTRSRHSHHGLARSKPQKRRGKLFMVIFFGVIVFTWVLFMGTAIVEMRGPKP